MQGYHLESFLPSDMLPGKFMTFAALYSLIASWEIEELDCVQFKYIPWVGPGGTTEQIRTLDPKHLIDKFQCSNLPDCKKLLKNCGYYNQILK